MDYKVPSKAEVQAVDLSWKRYVLPRIHPEGRKILAWEFVLFGVLGAAGFAGLRCWPLYALFAFWGIGLAALVFSFYFFRNPERVPPERAEERGLVVAPADGIVSNIRMMVPPPEMGIGAEERLRVSIFMSVFSVHVNRAPVGGEVVALKYVPGKFVSVQDKDSEDNERQLIGLRTGDGRLVGVVQIAGLVARRIFCPLQVGDKLAVGEVFGMIRFGSRLDVYLPPGVAPMVRLGQVAVAGETVLAAMKASEVA